MNRYEELDDLIERNWTLGDQFSVDVIRERCDVLVEKFPENRHIHVTLEKVLEELEEAKGGK